MFDDSIKKIKQYRFGFCFTFFFVRFMIHVFEGGWSVGELLGIISTSLVE